MRRFPFFRKNKWPKSRRTLSFYLVPPPSPNNALVSSTASTASTVCTLGQRPRPRKRGGRGECGRGGYETRRREERHGPRRLKNGKGAQSRKRKVRVLTARRAISRPHSCFVFYYIIFVHSLRHCGCSSSGVFLFVFLFVFLPFVGVLLFSLFCFFISVFLYSFFVFRFSLF